MNKTTTAAQEPQKKREKPHKCIVVYDRHDGVAVGATLKDAWEELVNIHGNVDPDDCTFYADCREVSVEFQVVEKQEPVIVG